MQVAPKNRKENGQQITNSCRTRASTTMRKHKINDDVQVQQKGTFMPLFWCVLPKEI